MRWAPASCRLAFLGVIAGVYGDLGASADPDLVERAGVVGAAKDMSRGAKKKNDDDGYKTA